MSEEEQSPTETAPPAPVETAADRNWKAAREKNQRLEEELNELRAMISKKNEPQDDEEYTLVERRQLKDLESRVANQLASLEAKLVPERLKARFSDLEQVVNDDTLARLEREEPEMFAAVKSAPDPMARGVAAYKAIKAMGYVGKDPISENKRKLEENQAKPGNINSAGGAGPLESAEAIGRGLSKDRKAARYAEIQKYKKG